MFYGEFLYLIFTYLRSMTPKEFIFDVVIPFIITVLYVIFAPSIDSTNSIGIVSSIITFNSILLGFTIAALAIILTNNSQKIKEAKQKPTERKFYKNLNLYQLLLIPFFYVSLAGFFELILSVLTLFLKLYEKKIILGINFYMIFHILFVGMRNLTNLFFVLFNDKSQS